MKIKKIVVAALFSTYLLSPWVFAQSEADLPDASEIGQQPQHPALVDFSACLKRAVDAERADVVSEESLGRVKNACQAELVAVKQALPQSIVDQMMALLDEGLLRELNR